MTAQEARLEAQIAALLECTDHIRRGMEALPSSYIHKAAYAFLSDWYGILTAIRFLLPHGMTSVGNPILIVVRSAIETMAQFCYLLNDPSTALEKSIYAFLISHQDMYLLNAQLKQIRQDKGCWTEEEEQKYRQIQKSCALESCPENDDIKVQSIINKVKKEWYAYQASAKKASGFHYWYRFYASVHGQHLSPVSLVREHAFTFPDISPCYTNLDPETMAYLYNFLSKQAHGTGAIINKDFGNPSDLLLIKDILINLFAWSLQVMNLYPVYHPFVEKIKEYVPILCQPLCQGSMSQENTKKGAAE